MHHFLEGFTSGDSHSWEMLYLNRLKDTEKHVEAYRNAEHVIWVFPLYTDAMPGIVKYFIEALEPLCGREDNPSLGFIIQSGLPEAVHLRKLQRYLEKLAERLGCPHTGTVVRGGVEGIQVQPPMMTNKLFRLFRELGKGYAETGVFTDQVVRKLASRERFSLGRVVFFRVLNFLGLMNFYWNMQLKKNKAFDKRFAQPYKVD
jgi:hypothetical protein